MSNIILEEVKNQNGGLVGSYYTKTDKLIQPQPENILLNYLPNKLIYPEPTRVLSGRRRTRVVLRQGMDNISLPLSQIVFFYTEDKMVYGFDSTGKKYIAEINLIGLERELDENFFRANRQFIININYIKSFRSYEKVKLLVKMEPDVLNDKYCIIISQEKTPVFRRWICTA
ncbi:MAG TPA: LytTR family DNA-binding domain-containing protein [Chitinophagaceae bacterium]|nr:LytTR family DNA-binding domain-containing protein [Chitinophagaceae bacterium]